MQGSLQHPESAPEKQKISVAAVAATGAALVAVVAIFWFLFTPRTVHAPEAGSDLVTMTSAEQEYVKNIQVGNISMSRAENFIHQEVTILSGEVRNAGNRPVFNLRLTTTFSDEMNQIALKETRAVLGPSAPLLAPGEERAFEISFDHVPGSWNMQQPSVVVVFLHFAPR